MSTGIDEAATSSGRNTGTSSHTQEVGSHFAADETIRFVQFRNGVTSPGSPGSEADSTINSNTFAPSILASRLGRSIYSSAGAAGSSLSLSGSGSNSPTIALTGFNAISTVLNNPSKRQHPIDPKSSRFPPVTPNHVPADIQKVKKVQLDSYLSSVRPEWDRFMRNQSMGRQGKATIKKQQQQQRQSTHDSSYDFEPLGKPDRRHRPTASMASLSADLQAVPPPQARKRLPNLSAVPQVFFSEEFDLGNPYTFDQVTERYKAAASPPSASNGSNAPIYDVALNQMLQEKLSYYSDVIEQHLIIEIGQQSSSFFAALGDLNDLNAEAESCLRKIDALKTEVQDIDEKQARKGLHVIREQYHRRQLERKQTAVQNVRQIIERRDLVRLLLQQGETEEALDLLDKLRSALRCSYIDSDQTQSDATTDATATLDRSRDDHVVLSKLQCLSSIPAQLEEMEQTLSAMLEQDLITILKQDIDARLTAYQQNGSARVTEYLTVAAEEPAKNGSAPQSLDLNPNAIGTESLLAPSKPPVSPSGHSGRTLSSSESELASRIAPYVVGLAKTGGIEKAIAAYRGVAIQAVQQTWKETLSRPGSDMAETVRWLLSEDFSRLADHDMLPPPAARIRDLDHVAFLEMGRELFETLLECLRAIDAQCKLIPGILDEYHASNSKDASTWRERGTDGDAGGLPLPPNMPSGVPTNLPAKLSDVVVASAEQSHSLCARLLTLRAITHAALELAPFLVIFQLCWSFVLSSEQLCRKMIVGLRGTVLSQAKGFLANFHRKRIERAAKAVEEETWAQAEVGADIQAQIRRIVSSAVEDPADFVVMGSENQADQQPGKDAGVGLDGPVSREDEAHASAKTLDIEDRQYFVVDASLEVLSLLVDYLKVIINLPLLTTEAMARVVEFLKQFNSRTCQVVLGAGAMRSAGLKNITAKHLALASQSLSIMISLIPYIRETVRRHLSPKQAVLLTEFDKLRRDFQEHQYEIHAKLVAIMSDRLTVHCRTLSTIDWNADKPTADGQGGDEATEAEPNKYAADMVKETATLHKVLTKYLQAVVVEHVIGQVLRSIDARVAQEFEKVPVQNQHALERMQTDVRHLGTKLSALKHVEWKDEALQHVLSMKHVAAAPTVSVSNAGGSSTPNTETAPGSPAVDKPAASPFGPVTYKPRIPNIFGRRQQQQHQSQSGSPRASTDVPGASSLVDAQRSVETTPRTSMQLQQQPPSTQEAPQGDAAVLEPAAKSNAPGARSIEEEMSEVPPTPPSKIRVMELAGVVKVQDADARDSEDIVAPAVPAPGAADKSLAEDNRSSSDVPAALANVSDASAPTSAAINVAESGQPMAAEEDKVVADHRQREAIETAARPSTSASQTNDTLLPEAAPAAVSGTSTTTEPGQPSTPTKKAEPPQTQQTSTSTPVDSSPALSGASTPATGTPSGTPAKPGRMSLKERLAEAARKRAQQSAPAARPASQAEAESASAAAPTQPVATAAASAAVKEVQASEVKAEELTKAASSSDAEAQLETTSAPAADASDARPRKEKEQISAKTDAVKLEAEVQEGMREAPKESAPESSVEIRPSNEKQEASQDHAEAITSAPLEANQEHSDDPSTSFTPETPEIDVTKTSNEAPERNDKDIDVAESEDKVKITAGNVDGHAAKPAEEAENGAAETRRPLNGTGAPKRASQDSSAAVVGEADADLDGDGDEDVDADANVNTNDSALGGTGSTGAKKNKKKKKKGKKK
ncbi:uncharacterized protein MEPE_02570 [Melanopsichium pennsylvanicum]|uniref:Vacuolar protein sorting-associated protein 54 n=2 Tax=Melanopsichium pennsylvanicum TaxID=63383 RepID=A0AAJ4XL19_9BASI